MYGCVCVFMIIQLSYIIVCLRMYELHIYLFIYLSIYLFFSLSLSLSIYIYIYIYIYITIYVDVCDDINIPCMCVGIMYIYITTLI